MIGDWWGASRLEASRSGLIIEKFFAIAYAAPSLYEGRPAWFQVLNKVRRAPGR